MRPPVQPLRVGGLVRFTPDVDPPAAVGAAGEVGPAGGPDISCTPTAGYGRCSGAARLAFIALISLVESGS
jgi:hypothetical protein